MIHLRWVRPGAMALAFAGSLAAQEPDPAEAYGVYRPAPPASPADTAAAADTAAPSEPAGDTPARDTAALVRDIPAAPASDSVPGDTAAGAAAGAPPTADSAPSPMLLDRVEEVPRDTSLTARMDVARGGGLRRPEFPDLRQSARVTGRYEVFLDLVSRGGFGAALADTAPLTVLAPTDSAFARLGPAALARLRSDSAGLAAWAASVLVEGDWTTAELIRVGEVFTLGGTAVRVARDGSGAVLAGQARVVQPDLVARNGRLHGVDRVVLPAPHAGATSAAP